MQVVGLDAHAAQVRRDFLCELDGQHGDQGSFSTLDAGVDFRQQIGHLPFCGTNLDARIQQPSRPDFHPRQVIDALQHLVHRGRALDFLGHVSRAGSALGRDVQQALGHRLPGHLAQVPQFSLARRGGDVHHLRHEALKLRELQRPVVCSRRQTEAVFDEVLLACPIAVVHATDLRQGHVRFVHDDEEAAWVAVKLPGACGEEVQQAVRAFSCFTSVEMP